MKWNWMTKDVEIGVFAYVARGRCMGRVGVCVRVCIVWAPHMCRCGRGILSIS